MGLFVAAAGLTLAIFIAEQLGVDLPTCVLTALGALAVAMIVGGLLIHFAGRRDTEESPKTPDLCKERLSRLAQSANRLGNELPNFGIWWPAIADPAFDGVLDGNFRTTHAEAMEALLYAFAQFFSAAWVYQDKCRIHEDRAEVTEWIESVYAALGKDPGPDPDVALNSKKLLLIGQRSTARPGKADAQPLPQSAFEDAMHKDVDLAAALRPLEEFLFAAAPNSPALARVEAADRAVADLKERLGEKEHHR